MSGQDYESVNKWDLDDIYQAGEMLRMQNDIESAYMAFIEKETEQS